MLWLRKCEGISQCVLGKSAKGSSQLEGSGEPVVLVMSLGMESRGKNQVLIPASRSSRAYICQINRLISTESLKEWSTYSPAVLVKCLPTATRRALNLAADIPVLGITVGHHRRPRLLPLRLHRAAGCRVQSHLVSLVRHVGPFHDVDFTICRPIIGVCQPKGWPGATAIRRVNDIEQEEASVVGLLGFNPDRLSSIYRVGVGRVDSENGGIIRRMGQVQVLCHLLVDISAPVTYGQSKSKRDSEFCPHTERIRTSDPRRKRNRSCRRTTAPHRYPPTYS